MILLEPPLQRKEPPARKSSDGHRSEGASYYRIAIGESPSNLRMQGTDRSTSSGSRSTDRPTRELRAVPLRRRASAKPADDSLVEAMTSRVPIGSLIPADSPRTAGESYEHARVLAEAETPLPPIIVHRRSMRVIDGMHRLRAAELRGQAEIDVLFAEGDADDAFVLAVKANITHGLPLSLADRTAAATRIIASHPHWSDRRIGSVTGLSGSTVGAIRLRSTDKNEPSNRRKGSDGRERPLSSAAARMLASELIKKRPTASIRQIAEAAGCSPSTVHDVRRRMQNGQDPVPPKQQTERRRRRASKQSQVRSKPSTKSQKSLGAQALSGQAGNPAAGSAARPEARQESAESALCKLKDDPVLRFNETGRALLRLIALNSVGRDQWKTFRQCLPPHLRSVVADAAREIAESWRRFAQELN